MKYLSLFENFRTEHNIDDYAKLKYGELDLGTDEIFCINENLTNLKGIEKFKNLKILDCSSNKISNLSGIENLGLTHFDFSDNIVGDFSQVLTLKDLNTLSCDRNHLPNLDGIESLQMLETLYCYDNPWKFPLPEELVKKFNIEYTIHNIEWFSSYYCQRDFLKAFPDRIGDLESAEVEIHQRILNEFSHIFD